MNSWRGGVKRLGTGGVTDLGGGYSCLKSRRGKFKLLDLQGGPSPPQFLRLVRYPPDLPMKKTLSAVGVLTVMIFFQSRKFTACKIKEEKE